ncbi:hypothetical protein PR048_025953 [Dryococelus australis]|uniref:Uncharacterized protein n=1 Tax=Dryococelus australis TaxID=614101 RepID=A0ABQ9GK23_9NEOP|nr:hypothetical protein PR048_025953 [Dryococelus australis]
MCLVKWGLASVRDETRRYADNGDDESIVTAGSKTYARGGGGGGGVFLTGRRVVSSRLCVTPAITRARVYGFVEGQRGRAKGREWCRRTGVSKHSPLHKSLRSVCSVLLVSRGTATIPDRLACSPPTKAKGFRPRPGHRIFASGNRPGRWSWRESFLRDLPLPPPFHSSAAPYSPQSPSSALKTSLCPNVFTHYNTYGGSQKGTKNQSP